MPQPYAFFSPAFTGLSWGHFSKICFVRGVT